MSYSRQQLVNGALDLLTGGEAGQQHAAEDYAAVDVVVPALLARLAAKRIVTIGNPDDIDAEAFNDLVVLLANMESIAPQFNRPVDRGVIVAAERSLREIYAEALSYQPLQTEYF